MSVRTARTAVVLAMISLCVVAPRLAQARTYSVLYNFTGLTDGGNPYGGLIVDARGNIYGTTVAGGASGNGTVFWDPTGTQTVLHSFAGGSDGRSPLGDLILDGKGNLYGTTYYGGTSDSGTVFKVNTATGDETVLYTFTGGLDGKWPVGVVRDANGNLFGATQVGGTYFAGVVTNSLPAGGRRCFTASLALAVMGLRHRRL